MDGRGGTRKGPPTQLVMGYEDGALLLTPVTPDEFLVIVTNEKTVAGKLSCIMEKSGARVAAAM